jgi:hypothetical protein
MVVHGSRDTVLKEYIDLSILVYLDDVLIIQ